MMEVNNKLLGIQKIFDKFPYFASLKYCLMQIGFPKMCVRPPLTELNQNQCSILKSRFKMYNEKNEMIADQLI